MSKKTILFLLVVFSFIFIGNHLLWIEDLFNLGYGIGQCVPSYLLFIVIVLLIKKQKN